ERARHPLFSHSRRCRRRVPHVSRRQKGVFGPSIAGAALRPSICRTPFSGPRSAEWRVSEPRSAEQRFDRRSAVLGSSLGGVACFGSLDRQSGVSTLDLQNAVLGASTSSGGYWLLEPSATADGPRRLGNARRLGESDGHPL